MSTSIQKEYVLLVVDLRLAKLLQVQGNELLQQRAKALYEEVNPFYDTLVDVMEFRDIACSVLSDVATSSSCLKLSVNPNLTSRFMNLVVIFMQVHVMLSFIPGMKAILAVFARTHQHLNSSEDPSFGK